MKFLGPKIAKNQSDLNLNLQNEDYAAMPESNEDRVTSHLVKEVNKIISSQRLKHGDNYAKDIQTQFLAKYIATLVSDSLLKFSGTRTKSKSEYDLVSANFSELKSGVQEAVGTAFSAAMSQFTGKKVEYFCNLSPVVDNVSKMQH